MMQTADKSYIKLPNGNIVAADAAGFFSTVVEVGLDEFIDLDAESVLDHLSEKATGSTLLSNFSYQVVRNVGNTLYLLITGQIDASEVETVDENELPDAAWNVQICRIGFGFCEVQVNGRTEAEATAKADVIAGDLDYAEKVSDYSFVATRVTETQAASPA